MSHNSEPWHGSHFKAGRLSCMLPRPFRFSRRGACTVFCSSGRLIHDIRAAQSVAALAGLTKSRSRLSEAELCAAFEAASAFQARGRPHNPKAVRATKPKKHAARAPDEAAHASQLMYQLHLDLLPALGQCSTRQLCQLLRAMAKSNCVPQAAFLQGVVTRLTHALETSIPDSQQQQQQPTATAPTNTSPPAQPTSSQAPSTPSIVPRDLCDISEGVSRLCPYNINIWMALKSCAMALGIQCFSLQEAASLARGMARALHYDAELLDAILIKAMEAVRTTLPPTASAGPDVASGSKGMPQLHGAGSGGGSAPSGPRQGPDGVLLTSCGRTEGLRGSQAGMSGHLVTAAAGGVAAGPGLNTDKEVTSHVDENTASTSSGSGSRSAVMDLACDCLHVAATFGHRSGPALSLLQEVQERVLSIGGPSSGPDAAAATTNNPWQVGWAVSPRQAAPLAWAAGLLGCTSGPLFQELLLCLVQEVGEGDSWDRGLNGSDGRSDKLATTRGARRVVGSSGSAMGSGGGTGSSSTGQGIKAGLGSTTGHTEPQGLSMAMQGMLCAAVSSGGRADLEGVRKLLGLAPVQPLGEPAIAGSKGSRQQHPSEGEPRGASKPGMRAALELALQRCAAAWVQLAARSRPSSSQQWVLRVLQSVPGVDGATEEVLTAEGFFCVDIVCRWRSRLLAIEVDGPQHSCANDPARLLGPSLARVAMLQSLGYAVVTIKTTEWHSVHEQAGQADSEAVLRAFLEARMNAAMGNSGFAD